MYLLSAGPPLRRPNTLRWMTTGQLQVLRCLFPQRWRSRCCSHRPLHLPTDVAGEDGIDVTDGRTGGASHPTYPHFHPRLLVNRFWWLDGSPWLRLVVTGRTLSPPRTNGHHIDVTGRRPPHHFGRTSDGGGYWMVRPVQPLPLPLPRCVVLALASPRVYTATAHDTYLPHVEGLLCSCDVPHLAAFGRCSLWAGHVVVMVAVTWAPTPRRLVLTATVAPHRLPHTLVDMASSFSPVLGPALFPCVDCYRAITPTTTGLYRLRATHYAYPRVGTDPQPWMGRTLPNACRLRTNSSQDATPKGHRTNPMPTPDRFAFPGLRALQRRGVQRTAAGVPRWACDF